MTQSHRILPYLLSVLVLLSQLVALTHASWHASHDAPGYMAHTEHDSGSSESESGSALCAFDTMLGQLLYGAAAGQRAGIAAEQLSLTLACVQPSPLSLALLHPRSRGPPASL